VVELFELPAECLAVNPLGLLPLLHASLDVPTRSGAVIIDDGFILGTIHEMQGSAQGFPHEIFLGKEKKNHS